VLANATAVNVQSLVEAEAVSIREVNAVSLPNLKEVQKSLRLIAARTIDAPLLKTVGRDMAIPELTESEKFDSIFPRLHSVGMDGDGISFYINSKKHKQHLAQLRGNKIKFQGRIVPFVKEE
jgi:hypothetical protein